MGFLLLFSIFFIKILYKLLSDTGEGGKGIESKTLCAGISTLNHLSYKSLAEWFPLDSNDLIPSRSHAYFLFS